MPRLSAFVRLMGLCVVFNHTVPFAGVGWSCVAFAVQENQPASNGASTSRAQTVPPVKVATVEDFTEYVLGNGLRILLCSDESQPTVTVNMVVLSGSRDEGPGEYGMAHMLEHMLGRSTTSFESVLKALDERGADYNADTWFDRTSFCETLAASPQHLEFAIHLEAERLTQAQLRPEDLAGEMAIITSEFEMIESDPKTVLLQQMMSAAFSWHDYGKAGIGTLSDIRQYPIENLRRFYRRHYRPDNAVLIVAGRMDPQPTLDLIRRYFGTIEAPGSVPDRTHTVEPAQEGPRSVTVKRAGDMALVGLMYHIPCGAHPDAGALQILQDLLVAEPTGRLYKALVTTGMASRVSADEDRLLLAEPGALTLLVEVRPDQDIQRVRTRTIEVVENVAASGVRVEEVERAKGRRLKLIRRTSADLKRMAIDLKEWTALGDWRTFFVHRDRLRAVTADDVQRVAREYLFENNRTTGLFLPTREPRPAAIPESPDIAQLVQDYRSDANVQSGEAFSSTPENIDCRTLWMELLPGIELALLQKKSRGQMVHAKVRIHFGQEKDLIGHTEALKLLPALLERGTRDLDFQQLRDEIDRLQADISLSGDVGILVV